MTDLTAAEVYFGPSLGGSLTIKVTGRTNPASTDWWDGNWLKVVVTIVAGGFRGLLEGYLRTDELADFKDELTALYKSLSGTAHFVTMEHWLSLDVIGDGRGHITVECIARDEPGIGNTLTFSLDFDQTFLPGILQSLEDIARLFPLIGTPV